MAFNPSKSGGAVSWQVTGAAFRLVLLPSLLGKRHPIEEIQCDDTDGAAVSILDAEDASFLVLAEGWSLPVDEEAVPSRIRRGNKRLADPAFAFFA